MIDATAEFAPVSLTRIVANDSVRMVEWWAANRCPTPIDGDELSRVRKETGLKAGHLLAWAVCNRATERDYYRATTFRGTVRYFSQRSPAECAAGTRGTVDFIEAGAIES